MDQQKESLRGAVHVVMLRSVRRIWQQCKADRELIKGMENLGLPEHS